LENLVVAYFLGPPCNGFMTTLILPSAGLANLVWQLPYFNFLFSWQQKSTEAL